MFIYKYVYMNMHAIYRYVHIYNRQELFTSIGKTNNINKPTTFQEKK